MQPIEPTAPTPQQAAVQEVRGRYERGEITYEALRRALDALLLAQNADECQVILQALPAAPLLALSALDAPPPQPASPSPAGPDPAPRKWYVAIMSQTKKLSRRWQLARRTHAFTLLGEVKLNLNLADLPPYAELRVTALLGTVIIYVPTGVRVSVRSTVLLSDVNALGESTAGVIAFGHEEHIPTTPTAAPASGDAGAPDTPHPAVALAVVPAPQIEVHVFSLLGNVQVKLTNRPMASVGQVMREVVALAADGIHRGLQQRASQRALPERGAGER